MERLKEDRVRSVIEPMLTGELIPDTLSDDYRYTLDLGLIRNDRNHITEPANPIYAEVMVRTLNWMTQKDLIAKKPDLTCLRYEKNGIVDMEMLLLDFQKFWRENSEIWEERYQYKEAAPHLVFQAFLQRVINGGGQIIREMSAGKQRADLCVVYNGNKYPIELKINRGPQSLADGLEQTLQYMNKFDAETGSLILFDRRPSVSWEEKLYIKTEIYDGKKIIVAGA